MHRDKLKEAFEKEYRTKCYEHLEEFVLSSISEILSEVCPKDMETTEWMGKYSLDVRKGYNFALSDLKQNIARLGYELTK